MADIAAAVADADADADADGGRWTVDGHAPGGAPRRIRASRAVHEAHESQFDAGIIACRALPAGEMRTVTCTAKDRAGNGRTTAFDLIVTRAGS